MKTFEDWNNWYKKKDEDTKAAEKDEKLRIKKLKNPAYKHIPQSISNAEVSYRLKEIIQFHCPENANILDPTCGKQWLWQSFDLNNYNVTMSDAGDFDQEFVCKFEDLKFDKEFDAIVFDPPYISDFNRDSDNPRGEDYAVSNYSLNEVEYFVKKANEVFPKFLKEDGKVIFKCSDVYNTKSKKFMPLHVRWIELMNNFELIDIMIHRVKSVSPTAYQVKNRPCSIVQHTYFLIFKRK